MLKELVLAARRAQRSAQTFADHETRCEVLRRCADLIKQNPKPILEANLIDLEAAKPETSSFRDRLRLGKKEIPNLVSSIEDIIALPDPIYQTLDQWERPSGLTIKRMSTPIGCLGVIFEARPNVTIDAAAICIKSGNSAVLRPGSSSFATSKSLLSYVHQALKEVGLPEELIVMTPTSERALVDVMLSMEGIIDLIIPRGGKNLINYVMDSAQMPVLAHREGNCHIYVHEDADQQMAINVIENAKLRRVSVCGAMESLLVHSRIAGDFIPKLLNRLDGRCQIVGCGIAREIDSRIDIATIDDWATEYLEAKFSVKVIDSLEDAATHINTYGSHHTDGIICCDDTLANRFAQLVDSAIIPHNASTQYADGGEFGFGAEIGIATGILPPRGPIGPQQLTTYRYIVLGHGHIRP